MAPRLTFYKNMTSEHSSITGQTVLVTGAGQGLGRATCLAFARRGAKIALVDINEGTLHDVREELNNSGAECTVIVGDISSPGAPQRGHSTSAGSVRSSQCFSK